MNNEDYVSIEQAQKLQKLGFDWECETFWDDEGSPQEHDWVIKHCHDYPLVINDEDCTIFRPTLSQAQKWLREKKGIYLMVCLGFTYEGVPDFYWYTKSSSIFLDVLEADEWFGTYEQALSDGIDKVLELLTTETNDTDN